MSSSAIPHSNDIHAKALAINLEASIYGTFAEIGAGQEVARWFLSVGAASGTVAQAISAYDKTVSDDTYGRGTRYVSRERLLAMLEHEYQLLLSRLGAERGAHTRFFVFADTVTTRNYQGTNEQHGWLGMRFQDAPGAPSSQILLHITLGDSTALLQQQAIGVLGVNLIYAAYHQRASAEIFLGGLFEDLSADRVEIDYLELSGPAFAAADVRVWSLELLRKGMGQAVIFDSQGRLVEPSSLLHKRPVICQRALLDDLGLFGAELLAGARGQLLAEGKKFEHEPVSVLEVSLHGGPGAAPPENAEVLEQIERLSPLGAVMVSQFVEGFHLVEYLRRHTPEPIRMVLGIAALFKLVEGRAYQASPGALLEIFGRLLATDVTLYVAPMKMEPFVAALGGLPGGFVVESAESDYMTLDEFTPKAPVDQLFRYLRGAARMVPLETKSKA